MKFLFVLNPNAGGVHAGAVRRLLEERFHGGEREIVEEVAADHLRERCLDMARTEDGVVVAVGGDGTVNRILNVLGPNRARMGILPLGSANDLAGSLGIPRDAEQACRVLRTGSFRSIDLLSVNGLLFATCGGTHVAAAIAARANRWKRSSARLRIAGLLGKRLYAVAALRELSRPFPTCSVTLDCPERVHDSDALALFASNLPRFGGRFTAAPAASIEDGYVDLCLLPRPHGLRGWGRLIHGAWEGDLASLPGAQLGRARKATVTASSPVRFFGDGEILLEGRVFDIRVLPKAARFITPAPAGGC